MNDKKKTSSQWKAEQLRAERKARLAALKSKEGGKKQIKTQNRTTRIVVLVVLIVALLLTGLWAVVRTGMAHRQLTAVTIGSEAIKAVDVNYYYYMQLSQFGLDPSDPESQKTLEASSGMDEFKTNADYIKDQAVQQLQMDVMLADQARKNGIALNESDHQVTENYIENLKSGAMQEGKTFENYLTEIYGVGVTEDTLRGVVERMLLSNRYAEEKALSFTFTDEECQRAYEENPDQYDVVNYRVFHMRADIPTGATSAEKTKAMQEAEAKANEMLEKVTDGESFRKLCIDYASEEEQATYRAEDVSLQSNKHQKDVTLTAQKAWLFDAERKPSDKTVIESSSGYYVLYFESRVKPEFPWAHVRHVLIQANQATADEAAIKAAKEKAESVLAEYKSGDQTEEAFAELARQYSEDGNASQGGLYENIYPGQMVEAFEEWCFDPSRNVGDTGIVQTKFGFHVMYYSGKADPDWKMNVTQTLRDKAYTEYVEQEVENYPYKTHSLGYRLVG